MRGATKIFQLIIILLQGSFAGVLLGQMVHLYVSGEPAPLINNIVMPAAIAGTGIVIFFFRKMIQQYLFSVGNIVWLHFVAPILFGVIVLLHLLSVLYNFEFTPLITYTFQLSSLFALALIITEHFVLHLDGLQNVYADLFRVKRMSSLLKNSVWVLSMAILTVLSISLYRSGGASLSQIFTTTLFLCSVIFLFLLLVKLKVMDMLKRLPLRQHAGQQLAAVVGPGSTTNFKFGNYYALEKDLLKVLLEANADERPLIYGKIRQIPLIDKIQELEQIQDKYLAKDGELESTIHFLRRLHGNILDKGIHYDLDSESSILEIRAHLRLGIAEGNPLLVQKLLNDNRPEVKKAALFATINFNEPSFIPALVNHLRDHEFAFAASEALFEYGDQCLPFLRAAKYRNKENSFFLAQCLELVERYKSDEARDFLIEMLNEPQKIFQYKAAIALLRNDFSLSPLHKTQILCFIETLIGLIATQREIRYTLEDSQDQLVQALQEEEKEQRELVDELLGAFLPASLIEMLQNLLANEADQKRASVAAIIDLFFPLSLRGKCKILMGSSKEENIAPALQNEYMNERVCFSYRSKEEAVRQILKMDYSQIGCWLRACALKKLALLPGQQVSLLILAEMFNKNLLLQEVASEVLYDLNYDYYFLQMQRIQPERAKVLKYKIEHNKLLNENGDIGENQLLFEKVLVLKSFPMFRNFSFEGLAGKIDLFSLISFDQTKQKVELDPYKHSGYWLVARGKFTLYHWGEESLQGAEGDLIDMSLLIEAEPNSVSFYAEGEVKVYFIEYFTLNKLYQESGLSRYRIIQPKLEQPAKYNLV